MTPRLDLRALDDRVVPVAAGRLRRLLDALAVRGRGGVPVVAPALIAVLLVPVGLGVAAAVQRDDARTAAPAPLAVRGVDAPVLAVVHLERPTAADDVPPLLDGVQVRRLYLHAGEAGPAAEVVVLPVDDVDSASLLPALCAATSERRAGDARDLTTHAQRLPGTTPQEQQARVELQEQAARAAAEAQAYAGSCTTTIAAAVEAPEQALDEVAGRAGVRAVEPAPAGTSVDELDVPPLLPGSATAGGPS